MSGRVPSLWLLACIALVASGCDVPMPLAPAEPVGEPPTWGDSFALPAEQPPSLLGAGLGNSGLPAGTVSPGDTGDWSGGDAVLGKALWTALCALCHGQSGEGGQLPGGGAQVPALSDAAVQGALSDKQMARSIALGKGAMPSFMRELDKPKLSGVIAHIRSLKK